ncbi:MAG: YitT family protein [Barnesiella sp.]|nr:YitT family protein [Barnesiella sp.]
MKLDNRKLWVSAKDYIFIVFGIFLYGFGFSAFIAPYGVITGGMTGAGQVVYYAGEKLFGIGIPVAVTVYVLNAVLLLIAYRIVGRTFCVRTIFGVTCVAVALGILMPLFPEPLVKGEIFMSILIGSMMCGIGLGTAFVHNGSSGGTDIVAAIMSKKTNVSVGRTMQYFDFCIITSSLLIFGIDAGIEKLVYGYVVLFVVSMMADWTINSNRQAVQFIIFSPHWEEIATAINNDAHRGCTVLNGMGWYSKKEVKVLLVMCRKIESVTIYRIIKSIDKNALITQAPVNGVYGLGFDELKLKMPKPKPKRTSDRPDPFNSRPTDHGLGHLTDDTIHPLPVNTHTPTTPLASTDPSDKTTHSGHPEKLS